MPLGRNVVRTKALIPGGLCRILLCSRCLSYLLENRVGGEGSVCRRVLTW